MFTELFQLGGDKGARQLIRENIELAKTVLVEKAAIDIDTLEDLGNLAH
ncbi:MAG: hypothetical protein JNJ47_08670 [Alphaproteobacteria bacterium]|nr:hypothetical protein [Alphaproteobacteria bacterium]